jgi:hypothetical protein
MRPHVSVVILFALLNEDFSKTMAAHTWDEMTDILAYGAADGNGRMAQRLYQERFPNR